MDICILCGRKTVSIDSHHIIPREYGGEKGPEIKLCVNCHNSIHRCANNPQSAEEFISLLQGHKQSIARKLITTINRAKLIGGESETISLNIKINRELHRKLKLVAEDRRTTLQDLVSYILKTSVG